MEYITAHWRALVAFAILALVVVAIVLVAVAPRKVTGHATLAKHSHIDKIPGIGPAVR